MYGSLTQTPGELHFSVQEDMIIVACLDAEVIRILFFYWLPCLLDPVALWAVGDGGT